MPQIKVPYVFVLNFDSDVAASGGTSTKDVNIDSDGDFIVEDYNFEAWITSALGNAVTGTPLARDPSPSTTNNNQMPSLAHLSIELSTTDQQQWQNGAVRVSNLVRKSEANWMQTQRRIARGTRVSAKLTNNAAVAVQGQLALIGYRLRDVG